MSNIINLQEYKKKKEEMDWEKFLLDLIEELDYMEVKWD